MKIAICGEAYYPGTNGQAAFTIRLAEGLAQKGHDVMAVVPSEKLLSYREDINGVQVQKVAALNLSHWRPELFVAMFPGRQVRRVLRNFQPDVIHIQDHYILSRFAVAWARSRKIPVVGTNHFLPENLLPFLSFLPVAEKTKIRWLWKSMLNLYNRVQFVTTPTETAARILRQQDIHVPVLPVSCGVNTDRFQPNLAVKKDEVLKKYGLDLQKITFMYIGRLDAEKRLDILLQAFHDLQRDDIQLAIAGRGSFAGSLHTLAKKLNLEQKVIFTGFVPAEELSDLLNCADLFVMPSPEELQSIATLEAMSVGKPILAAAARALPELVQHGANGYLFEPNCVEDALRGILTLAGQPELWAEMGRGSLEKVRRHQLSATIDQYQEIFEEQISLAAMMREGVILEA
jgi:glycosyltransferase involved in cell wall biosynthesis